MNKTSINKFAIWARTRLEEDIIDQAGLIGVSDKGITQPLPQSTDDLLFLDIVTKGYAKVLCDNIVDFSVLDIMNHSLGIRSVKIRSRLSIVNNI